MIEFIFLYDGLTSATPPTVEEYLEYIVIGSHRCGVFGDDL